MRIKACEMERIFAFSSNGLKLYEKMGVIAPRRNTENGYRTYGGDELTLMGMATKLRGFGFSVSETAALLRINAQDFSREYLVRQEESISQKVAQLQQTQATIRRELKYLDLSTALLQGAQLLVRPGMFFLAFRKGDEPIDVQAAERLGNWIERYTPHACPAAMLNAAYLQQTGEADPTPVSGLCVDAKIVDELGLIPSRQTYYLPPKHCIVLGVEISSELDARPLLCGRLAQAEKTLDVQAADRGLLRYYACRELEGKVVRNGLLWVPIKEEEQEVSLLW